MQKKTKLQLADVLFVLTCLIGSTISIWCFEQSLNRVLTKNEKPIAKISYKEKIAQRQFLDEIMWDRLRENSVIYEGDLISTMPGAVATVLFLETNDEFTLNENTLVRIHVRDDGSKGIDLEQGNISANSIDGEFSIKAGSSVITLDRGSSLNAGMGQNKSFSIQVRNGNATYFDGEGNIQIGDGNGITVDEDGNVKQGALSVNRPSMSERYLNFTDELYPVDFRWSAGRDDAIIELSDSKNFNEIRESYHIKGTFETTLLLGKGVHYWRISVDTDQEGVSEVSLGKIEICQTHVPDLIAPVENYQVSYRTKKPTMRFIWKESEYATAYQFEISRSPEMTSPVYSKRISNNSIFVSELPFGNYYWRVTPYYTINRTGFTGPSEVSSFAINQSGELEKPSLILPAQTGIVNTRIPLSNGASSPCKVNFSWKDCAEAQNYEIQISKTQNFGNAVFRGNTYNNYFVVNTENVTFENGKWYWRVIAKDSEGNTSISEVRDFIAIDANIEQRTLFPVDGYRTADSRMQDTRFVWKSNIPGDTIFEIARDKNFENVIYSQTTINNSVQGRYLVPNTYYWRIRSKIEELTFATPAKQIVVEPPMPAPVFTVPGDRGLAVVRPKTPFTFKWNTVPGADYYQIKIFNRIDKQQVIFERNFIESYDGATVSFEMDLENYAETTYGLSLQAFREETPVQSRASSYLGDYIFTLVKIKPIDLISPEDKISIGGVDAVKKPGTVRWSYVGTPYKTALVVYKDKIDDEHLFRRVENPERTVQMPRLYEGKYYWTVIGFTEDDFDISADGYRTIDVGPIEKLAAPQIVEPKNRETLDKNYFQNRRHINFEWKSVSGADRYEVTILNPSKEVIFKQIFPKNVTKFVFEDLSKLSGGTFTWTVEAQSLWEGDLFQNGKIDKNSFKINLPNLAKPKTYDNGVRYGR
ncbi:MAG: hypothetical protein J6Y36_00895 [Treponema sp.]|nr:hypothetical protein [Treponema sp.]